MTAEVPNIRITDQNRQPFQKRKQFSQEEKDNSKGERESSTSKKDDKVSLEKRSSNQSTDYSKNPELKKMLFKQINKRRKR
jgi:hypothetical protein